MTIPGKVEAAGRYLVVAEVGGAFEVYLAGLTFRLVCKHARLAPKRAIQVLSQYLDSKTMERFGKLYPWRNALLLNFGGIETKPIRWKRRRKPWGWIGPFR